MVKLSQVATVNPRLPKDIDETQRVSFVAMASASEEGFLLSEEHRVLSDTRKGFTYFEKGDVLLAKITPCFENGKCLRPNQITNQIGFGSTEFHVLRANPDKIDSAYLFYMVWNKRFRYLGEASMSGAAGQKRVSTDVLKKFEIPLPPLPEQKRIAAILDKADAIRRKRRQAIQLADEFLRSVFLDMFGDPVTNPKGWKVKILGEVIKVKSGDGLVAKDMAPNGQYPVYGGNGINGYHDSYMFDKQKIVLGRVGVYCGAVHLTKPKAWITDNALYVHELLVPIDTTYLIAALKFANLNQYAGKAAQPLISGSRIYPVAILFPELKIQRRYATIVASIKQQKNRLNSHLAELDILFASLTQRAFRGEL